MRNYFFVLGLFILFVGKSVSAEVISNDIAIKYNEMIEQKYLQKLIKEREVLEQSRNTNLLIRDYENAKILSSLEPKSKC